MRTPILPPITQTVGGRAFNFAHPEDFEYDVEEIAHALSNLCRFTGHTTKFYSVAQHSVLVSRMVKPGYALEGLMHDASEAFLGDVSTPLKQYLIEYAHIERRVDTAIRKYFGLPICESDEVKGADRRVLATEFRDLMPLSQDRPHDVLPYTFKVEPWAPEYSRQLFIDTFQELYYG